jgi:hypothetical protein
VVVAQQRGRVRDRDVLVRAHERVERAEVAGLGGADRTFEVVDRGLRSVVREGFTDRDPRTSKVVSRWRVRAPEIGTHDLQALYDLKSSRAKARSASTHSTSKSMRIF